MLTTKEPLKDLGNLKYGLPHSFNYFLTNESPDPVSIDKIIVGCGSCTTAQTRKTNLAPGESTLVEAVYTPGSTGDQRKNIQIKYGGEVLKLEFTAHVDP